MSVRPVLALALLAVLALGQACRKEAPFDSTKGDLGISWTGADGAQRTDRDARFDFGVVPFGDSHTRTLVIRNLGPGPLTLKSLEHVEGVAVRVAGQGDGSAVFDVPFTAGRTVNANESIELSMTYTPAGAAEQTDDTAVLLVRAENTWAGSDTARITLHGRGMPRSCELPKTIDFGKVMLGTTQPDVLAFSNDLDEGIQASIGEIHSGSAADALAFHWAAGAQPGTLDVDAHAAASLPLEFRPLEAREYVSFVRVQLSGKCPAQEVQLRGTGVETPLTWLPASITFGFVPVGSSLQRTVTFRNLGRTPIVLSGFSTPASAGDLKPVNDGNTLMVPAAQRDGTTGEWIDGTAELSVVCSPSVPGPRAAAVRFATDLSSRPMGEIAANWFGGGPNIAVTPSPAIAFGKVAYFASTPTTVKKTIRIRNTGLAIRDANANLHLSEPLADGMFGPAAHLEITPLNGTTSASEFTASVSPAYDNVKGLSGFEGENNTFIEVGFTPASLGLKEVELAIHTNLIDEPVVRLEITAEAVSVPSCQYSVSETALDFGVVHAPAYVDRVFQIRNLGTASSDVCLISSGDVSASSDDSFAVISGTTTQELGPGEVRQVVVRSWPSIATPQLGAMLTGSVDLYVSSEVKPLTSVPVTAHLQPSCIDISPADFDFGAVLLGCSAATRTFNVYNTCDVAVTLKRISLLSAAGQSAGDPECAGSDPCPEFSLEQLPTIPASGLTLSANSAPVTFQVKYRPIDVGVDLGTVSIETAPAVSGAANDSTLVTLRGSGDPVGTQIDDLSVPEKPKADILLVIDTSGCMSDDQQDMSLSTASFLEYAKAANVDFHVATTTTDMDPGGVDARLIVGRDHQDKVVTRASAHWEDQIAAKMFLGEDGSGHEQEAEPALRALTPPLVDSDNFGFLRSDASLAIVALTDEYDQSPRTTAYYLDRLWNIKGHSRRNQFTFSAIAPFTPACKQMMGGGDAGQLAFYLAETAGTEGDDCSLATAADTIMKKIGKTAFGFRTKYFLTSIPDQTRGPITVTADGQLLAPAHGNVTVWSYDSVSNAITFDEVYAPLPGVDVKVSYPSTCYP